MPTLFDHTPTAFRKMLRETLEGQFAQASSFINRLCEKMYAKEVQHRVCAELYIDIKSLLTNTEATFAYYSESRKRAIGVDADGDISFIKTFLKEYKLKINQLEKGVEDAKQHEYRFETQERKQQSIKILESFSSYNKDIECQLENLQRQYNELESDVYAPQSDEVVLNRLKQHIYDVIQSIDYYKLLYLITGTIVEKGYIDVFGTRIWFRKNIINVRIIHSSRIELFTPLLELVADISAESSESALSLAHELAEQKFENEQLDAAIAYVCSGVRAKHLQSILDQPNDEKRRGRRTVEKFHDRDINCKRLGRLIKETFRTFHHATLVHDMRQGGKRSFYLLLAFLIALNGGDPNRVSGKIACFCRWVKNFFGILGHSLRSFQYYIHDYYYKYYIEKDKKTLRTRIVNDVERVIIRNKKFFSGEQLVSQVGSVLIQNEFISYC